MKLGVNIDHIATLRQARGGLEPDPMRAAVLCETLGAHSIVMHLREDRRHIQDRDLFYVKDAIDIKLNMEMSLAPGIVRVAEKLCPDQVTLVPEKRQERTTESGLDLFKNKKRLMSGMKNFKRKKIDVSLFIDPDLKQLKEAVRLGVQAVEFHTGTYALETSKKGVEREWERLNEAVQKAREWGLVAHAGHGLDYQNVLKIKKIYGLEELNIGYSIVQRAVWVGFEQAVKEMMELVQ